MVQFEEINRNRNSIVTRSVSFEVAHFGVFRPLAPIYLPRKNVNYERNLIGKCMGARARERGQNDAWFRPLTLSLSPTAIAAKRSQVNSYERDVCGGEGTICAIAHI